MKSFNQATLRLAVAAALSCPLAAIAQEQPAPAPQAAAEPQEEVVGLEEVVITAQKRQQSLQDVPLSVSAFTGDMLSEGRMADIRAIVDFTPGFSGNTADGFTDALSMRGISTNDFGIGGDPSVAMFEDGIWAGRTGGVMTSMFDVERVEVVKGPQGTLFGRNSIAGAVSTFTNKPQSVFGASAELSLADHEEIEANAMVNIPLGDEWAMRVAGYLLDNDGYLDNLAGGDDLGYHQVSAGRVSLRRSGETLDATLIAAYEDREQDPSVYWVPAAGLSDDEVNIGPRRRWHQRVGRLRGAAPARLDARRRLYGRLAHRLQEVQLPLSRGLRRRPGAGQRLPPGQRGRVLEPGTPAQLAGRRPGHLVRGR